MATERFVPISEDFRVEDNRFNIVKGLRNLVRDQADVGAGLSFEVGDWAVKGDDETLSLPGATPVENTYPIWDGETPDVNATGKATFLRRNGFVVKTTKFVSGTYHAGDKLCVKTIMGTERVPSKATTGEYFVAVVDVPPNAAGVMVIKIVEGGLA